MGFFKKDKERSGVALIGEGRSWAGGGLLIQDAKLRQFLAQWKLEHILDFPHTIVVYDGDRLFSISKGHAEFVLDKKERDWAQTYDRCHHPRKIVVARNNALSRKIVSLIEEWQAAIDERNRNRPQGGASTGSGEDGYYLASIIAGTCGG